MYPDYEVSKTIELISYILAIPIVLNLITYITIKAVTYRK